MSIYSPRVGFSIVAAAHMARATSDVEKGIGAMVSSIMKLRKVTGGLNQQMLVQLKTINRLDQQMKPYIRTMEATGRLTVQEMMALGGLKEARERLMQRIVGEIQLRDQLQKKLTDQTRAMAILKGVAQSIVASVYDMGMVMMYLGSTLQGATQEIVSFAETFRKSFVDVYGGFVQTGIEAGAFKDKLVEMSTATGIKIDELAKYMSKLAVVGADTGQAMSLIEHAFIKSMGSAKDMSGYISELRRRVRGLSESELPAFIAGLEITAEEQDAYNKILATSEFQTLQYDTAMKNLSITMTESLDAATRNYSESMMTLMGQFEILDPMLQGITGALISQGPVAMQTAGSMLFLATATGSVMMKVMGLSGVILSFMPLILSLPGPLRVAAGIFLMLAGGIAAAALAWHYFTAKHWTEGIASIVIGAVAIGAGIAAVMSAANVAATSIPEFQYGGMVPGVGPRLAVLHGGEEVIPADEAGRGGMTFIINNYGNEMDEMELGERISDILHRRAGF